MNVKYVNISIVFHSLGTFVLNKTLISIRNEIWYNQGCTFGGEKLLSIEKLSLIGSAKDTNVPTISERWLCISAPVKEFANDQNYNASANMNTSKGMFSV